MDSWETFKIGMRRLLAAASCARRGLISCSASAMRHAEVMFIGEGPGEQEDLQGEPFVGPAGKLLGTICWS